MSFYWQKYDEYYILQGVLTGISYNGMRPLDMAHQKSHHTMVRGVLTPLTSIPYDYKVIGLKPVYFMLTKNV